MVYNDRPARQVDTRGRGGRGLIPIVAALIVLSGGAGPVGPGPGPELSLYAAASLRDVLAEIAPVCERETGARLAFNIAASNLLARQIEAAGRADIFLSADAHWMDRVARGGLIDASSRRTLLTNRLVVVAPGGGQRDALRVTRAADLAVPAVRRLSLARPDAVPAGRYARAWLEAEGVWDALKDRVIPALDARAALAAVEAGAAEAGIVYATDAALSRRVRVVHEVTGETAPRIEYQAAALAGRPFLAQARSVLRCLAGEQASAVFERFGFTVARADGGEEHR